MVRELDCRGLACPAPVLQTKQLLEKESLAAIKVIVDNEAARQNVTRLGWNCGIRQCGMPHRGIIRVI